MHQPQQSYPQQPTPYPHQPGIPQQGYPHQAYPTGYSPVPTQVPSSAPVQCVAPTTTVTTTLVRPRQNYTWDGYNARGSMVLGWLQITISFISIILFAVGIHIQKYREICYMNRAFYGGTGFWTAIFFIISGGFALGAAKRKTTCMIITNMVMSIISCVFGFALFGTSAAILGIENDPYGTNEYGYSSSTCYGKGTYRPNDKFRMTGQAFGSILLILSLTEIVACIVSSAFCCASVCCGKRSNATQQDVGGQTSTTVTGPVQQPAMGQYPVYQQAHIQPYNPQYQGPQGPYQGAQEPTAPPPYQETVAVKM